MYIRPKKVFWTLVLLAAVLYAGAHLLVRTSWARAQVLRGLSVRTGYAASASEIRFTPGLALSFRDFRLEIPGAGADAAGTRRRTRLFILLLRNVLPEHVARNLDLLEVGVGFEHPRQRVGDDLLFAFDDVEGEEELLAVGDGVLVKFVCRGNLASEIRD